MKKMMIHSTAADPNSPTEVFRVEKPPVASVVNAWQRPSYQLKPGEAERDPLGRGETHVDHPQRSRRGRQPRFHLVCDRSGHLRLEKLHAADSEKGQNRDGEENDPHAAEPLAHGPPQQGARVAGP